MSFVITQVLPVPITHRINMNQQSSWVPKKENPGHDCPRSLSHLSHEGNSDQPALSPSWCRQRPSLYQECTSLGSTSTQTSACLTTRWQRSCWPRSMQSHRMCRMCDQSDPKVEDLALRCRLSRWCGTEHTWPWRALPPSWCHRTAPRHLALAQALWKLRLGRCPKTRGLHVSICTRALRLEPCRMHMLQTSNVIDFTLLEVRHTSAIHTFGVAHSGVTEKMELNQNSGLLISPLLCLDYLTTTEVFFLAQNDLFFDTLTRGSLHCDETLYWQSILLVCANLTMTSRSISIYFTWALMMIQTADPCPFWLRRFCQYQLLTESTWINRAAGFQKKRIQDMIVPDL